MKIRVAFLLTSLFILCSGCADADTGGEMDYEKTKKMVVDILKTDDGKKAIQDVLSDDGVKSELIMNQDIVTKTVEKTLTSDKGKKFWEEAFKDPEFTAAYAKALKTEHTKLLKDLTKDPTYRGMVTEIMKEPDLQKELTKLLKTNEMRTLYKDLIVETSESPMVQAKMEELLKKAATEAVEKDKKESEKK